LPLAQSKFISAFDGKADVVERKETSLVSVDSGIETVRYAIALTVAGDRQYLRLRHAGRRIRHIFLSSRRSLESCILLNRQCAMENITVCTENLNPYIMVMKSAKDRV
jgi:hypothetical protein